MKKLNINPKGLKTGDCVVKAIAYAMGKGGLKWKVK